MVRLLDTTLIRVGNDEYARENQSFGLTTLRGRHVKVEGAMLRFSFRGKSGVEHDVAITDRAPRRASSSAARTCPGQELFQYLDDDGQAPDVSSDDVNAYLREITGRDFTAKDFRTWARHHARRAGAARAGAGGDASARPTATSMRALDAVAERLGNTRTVCRKYYVHPGAAGRVSDGPHRRPSFATFPPQFRGSRHPALRQDEVAVLQFLQEEASGDD